MSRVYLDHNATTPLRPEARDAMIAAMDVTGNPSSVHSEGRAAKALIERARADLAQALDAPDAEIVFVGSATEAAALACSGRGLAMADVEHDAVGAWRGARLACDARGQIAVEAPGESALQSANSETGVVQDLPHGLAVSDMTQSFGKLPLSFADSGARMAIVSAHKLGGPKGIGALVMQRGQELPALIRGGGQEMGRRAGTENVIGIAGFAAAASAAVDDVAQGAWDRIERLRDLLEARLADGADVTYVAGDRRLPNTSCLIAPGWKGETQVMRMDLSGFAISAGSACSSGKVRASGVLQAMGYTEAQAGCAIRVSLGLETTEDDVMRFADAWLRLMAGRAKSAG